MNNWRKILSWQFPTVLDVENDDINETIAYEAARGGYDVLVKYMIQNIDSTIGPHLSDQTITKINKHLVINLIKHILKEAIEDMGVYDLFAEETGGENEG